MFLPGGIFCKGPPLAKLVRVGRTQLGGIKLGLEGVLCTDVILRLEAGSKERILLRKRRGDAETMVIRVRMTSSSLEEIRPFILLVSSLFCFFFLSFSASGEQ